MRNLSAADLKEMQLFKYYRLVRRWVCKTYDLKDADLELLIYLDCLKRFTRQEFKDGTHIYTWDQNRWARLKKEGWIDIWRRRNRTTMKYSVYKVSFKGQQLISRIYRILLGEEDLPTSSRSVFFKNDTYTAKVMNTAIQKMQNDPER